MPFGLFLGVCILLGVNGDANLNSLFTDIITKFRLISPTIIYQGEIPEICITHHWLLCLDQEDEIEIHPDEDIKQIQRGKSNFTLMSSTSTPSVYL